MTRISARAGHMGWQEEEKELLKAQVEQVRLKGLPLRTAFEQMAEATGRKPNSIRNYYYAAVKEGSLTAPRTRAAFTPFCEEEIESLIEQVLSAQARGVSVRSITMTLAQGDKKAMLRYQNKYRSMVKHNPEEVLRIHDRMAAEGKATFNPYLEPKPHRSGRKSALPMDDTLKGLAHSLKDIKAIDAGVFLEQLATIIDLASRAG
ncbi:MAG: hypothetical protein E7328_05580 [Clostridiales bacterium]|nr:hypothetical protein [Clostridiales bacterium]